jgi:hypothetical protein
MAKPPDPIHLSLRLSLAKFGDRALVALPVAAERNWLKSAAFQPLRG